MPLAWAKANAPPASSTAAAVIPAMTLGRRRAGRFDGEDSMSYSCGVDADSFAAACFAPFAAV
jgi:hypothetical protein